MLSYEYQEYIKSPEWAAFRARYFATHAKACAACWTRDGIIHLHHHTYVRLGHEHPDDVVPLCQDHHRQVHDYARSTGTDLTSATFAFIKPRIPSTPVSPERVRQILRDQNRRDLATLKHFVCRVLALAGTGVLIFALMVAVWMLLALIV